MRVRINSLCGAILLCLLIVIAVGVVSAGNSPQTEALRGETAAAAAAATRELQIYFIDVEGGQATLFVTPEKHSLLIDTGFAGNNGRDSDRIVAAARKAGH